MKKETQAARMAEKIQKCTKSQPGLPVRAQYQYTNDSVQAELRLTARWGIKYTYDSIHYPKNLSGEDPEKLWAAVSAKGFAIRRIAALSEDSRSLSLAANSRTRAGAAKREEAELDFRIDSSRIFLAAYRKATSATSLENIRKKIENLQAQQKALLPLLRRANAKYLADRKSAKAEQRRRNEEALFSGRFWEADRDALKGYFHPPFSKNALVDVSEKWRAALFVECGSTGWKDYNKNWRHKLVGTGLGYLCGIDDNGDEWGYRVRIDQSGDQYGNTAIEGDVEEVMCGVFRVSPATLQQSYRQGDLLFCPEEIPEPHEVCRNCGQAYETTTDLAGGIRCLSCYSSSGAVMTDSIELHEQSEPWEVRESHRITSAGLMRNGRYFASENEITVSHTNHAPVILPAGTYRLYTSRIEDAD